MDQAALAVVFRNAVGLGGSVVGSVWLEDALPSWLQVLTSRAAFKLATEMVCCRSVVARQATVLLFAVVMYVASRPGDHQLRASRGEAQHRNRAKVGVQCCDQRGRTHGDMLFCCGSNDSGNAVVQDVGAEASGGGVVLPAR